MPRFRAGAAETGLQDVIIAHWAKKGIRWETRPYDPLLRCLVLESEEGLIIFFSADWGFHCRWEHALDADFKGLAAAKLAGRTAQVFCFATCANHDVGFDGIEWGALRKKDKRYDEAYHHGLLRAAGQVLEEALAGLRDARLSFGQGQCDSITRNGFWLESAGDTRVGVLRLDDTENRPIAVLVNFAARGDDRALRTLSGGFPRIMEQTVQRLYRDAPVFFFNGGYGRYLALRRNLLGYEKHGDEAHVRAVAQLLDEDYLRIGRILGDEVCKVLAEIETARAVRQGDNGQAREAVFAQPSPGLAIDQPHPHVDIIKATLCNPPTPSVDECASNLRDCETQLKLLRKRLGDTETVNTYDMLQPDGQESDVVRLVELKAGRDYWARLAGRAKQEARGGFLRPVELEIGLLVFSPELAVVMVPGLPSCSPARAIRKQSPFPHTLVWIVMAHTCGMLLPEAEARRSGRYAGHGIAQESLDSMVRSVAEGLRAVRRGCG